MNKTKRIILYFISALIIVIGVGVFFQWDNIKAIYIFKTRSDDEIEEMLYKSTEIRKEAVVGIPVRELTEEEQKEIKCGDLSSEEALKRIISTASDSSNYEDNSKGQVTSVRDYDAELADLIGQIYVLEATFSGAVDNLVSSAVAEYKALPPEQHTDANKLNVGLKYLGTATSLEASCDQQMATILSKIEGILIESGGDLALVSKIKSAYQSEKITKKNYYMSLYS